MLKRDGNSMVVSPAHQGLLFFPHQISFFAQWLVGHISFFVSWYVVSTPLLRPTVPCSSVAGTLTSLHFRGTERLCGRTPQLPVDCRWDVDIATFWRDGTSLWEDCQLIVAGTPSSPRFGGTKRLCGRTPLLFDVPGCRSVSC